MQRNASRKISRFAHTLYLRIPWRVQRLFMSAAIERVPASLGVPLLDQESAIRGE